MTCCWRVPGMRVVARPSVSTRNPPSSSSRAAVRPATPQAYPCAPIAWAPREFAVWRDGRWVTRNEQDSTNRYGSIASNGSLSAVSPDPTLHPSRLVDVSPRRRTARRSEMKTTLFAVALTAAGLMAAPPVDRLTDRDVKALAEHIDTGLDAFKDALPGNVKDGVIRDTAGEVKVDKYLDDFNTSIDNLKDRLKPDYSASAEAKAVLTRATAIDEYISKQSGAKGESEWNRL